MPADTVRIHVDMSDIKGGKELALAKRHVKSLGSAVKVTSQIISKQGNANIHKLSASLDYAGKNSRDAKAKLNELKAAVNGGWNVNSVRKISNEIKRVSDAATKSTKGMPKRDKGFLYPEELDKKKEKLLGGKEVLPQEKPKGAAATRESDWQKFLKQKLRKEQEGIFQQAYNKKKLDEQTKGLGRVGKAFFKVNLASKKLGSQKNAFQRIGWGFTMMSLSALGVYFSMYGLVNVFKAATMGLFGQVLDLDGAFGALGNTIAFGGEQGEELIGILGGTEGISSGIVSGWEEATGIAGMFKLVMVALASDVMPLVAPALRDVAIELAKAFSDPKIIQGIADIIIEVANLIPDLVNLIPVIADVIKVLSESGMLGVMLKLMVAALFLMPILSVIAGLFQYTGAIVKVVQIIMGAFGIEAIGTAGAVGGLASRLSFLLGPIGIVIGIVLTIITYFGWWDDIIRVLGNAVGWLIDKLQPLLDILGEIGEMLKVGGDIIGRVIFGEEYTPGAGGSPEPTQPEPSSYTTTNNYNITTDPNSNKIAEQIEQMNFENLSYGV